MERLDWIKRLFETIDAMDADGFASFLANDVVFIFGNAAAVTGRAAAREGVKTFFGSIAALHHDVERLWDVDDAAICQGHATYTRHDGSTLRVPFANILIVREDLITEYLIFVDISELYRAA